MAADYEKLARVLREPGEEREAEELDARANAIREMEEVTE